MQWHTSNGRVARCGFAAALLLCAGARAQNLVPNGDFESGYTGFATGLTYWPAAAAGTYSINHPSNAPNGCCWVECDDHTPSGAQMMLVDGAAGLVWRNAAAISVQPNAAYLFRYWFLTLDLQRRNASVLRLAINGVVQADDSLATPAPVDCTWRSVMHVWLSGGANTATVSLTDMVGFADGNDFGLDDIELSPCLNNLAVNGPGPVCEGLTADLYASAGGTAPFTYQWRRNGVNLANAAGHIAGAQTSHLSVVVAAGDAGTYDCVVGNWCATLATPGRQLSLGSFDCPWAEQGDAGSLPGTAQAIFGNNRIVGTIGADDADMYRIHICRPDLFSATTVSVETQFDTQLFLFDRNGAAVAANDDLPAGGSYRSLLTNLCVAGPGPYYLAVSAYNKDPLAGAPPALMFADAPWAAEHCADGPAAAGPVAGWTAGPGLAQGRYFITLTGTCAESPCGSPDFDSDGDVGTDADIEAFFSCLGGNCCFTCGSVDFNEDGDMGTDGDIESFFRVLSGGPC